MFIRASRNPWQELAIVIGSVPVGFLHPIPPPDIPFSTKGIDHIGSLAKTSNINTRMLVCVDYATRWVIVKAVPSTATLPVNDFLLNQVLWQHGTPRKLIVFKTLGTQHAIATAYYPQTNDLCEMTAGTLSGILTALLPKLATETLVCSFVSTMLLDGLSSKLCPVQLPFR